jgi:hypothetical protein
MNKLSAAVAALIALVVFSAQVARSQILADVLTLKSGEKVDGRITAESDLSVTKPNPDPMPQAMPTSMAGLSRC